MDTAITILHMTLTFITSTVVAVLGYLKFQDRIETSNKDDVLEKRIVELEKKAKKKHKKE